MKPTATDRSDRFPISRIPGALAPGGALLLGLALRLKDIAVESPWCDEVLTLQCLPAPGLGAFLACAFGADPRLALSPLYYLLEYWWTLPFGGSTTALRLLSVALGLAALWLLAAAARQAGGGAAAWRAALVGACALSWIYYAQEVRFYALLLLLGALSWATLLRALEHPGRRRWWALHFAANAAMPFTHAFAPVLWIGQGIGLAAALGGRDRRVPAWGMAHGAALAAFAVYAMFLRYDLGTHSEAFSDARPGLREVATGLLILTGARFSGESAGAYLPLGRAAEISVAVVVVAMAFGGCLALARPSTGRREQAALLALGAAAPFLALLAVSWGWRPVFFARYILPASVPLYILASVGWAAIPPMRARWACNAALVAVLAYPAVGIARPFRPDYNAFAADVAVGPSCHKRVIALKTFNGFGARHAVGAYAPVLIEEGYGDMVALARRELAAGREVWAVFHHWSGVGDFVETMRADGHTADHRVYAGMPPLHAVALRNPRADAPPPDDDVLSTSGS